MPVKQLLRTPVFIVMLLLCMPLFAQDASPPATEQVLVWIGAGEMPGDSSGLLALVDGSGLVEELMELPAQTNRVLSCGAGATSPDGRHFAFYAGQDAGALYLMSGTETPQLLDDSFHVLGCTGGGGVRYTPNSAWMAFMDYASGAPEAVYASGWLRVVDTEQAAVIKSFENVTAFDMGDGQLAFISFFTNARGEAIEAAVTLWDGQVDREEATLFAQENCFYTSASLAFTGSRLTAILGHRCRSGETRTFWQLYIIEPARRSATLAFSELSPGAFFASSATNSLFPTPDGGRVIFAVPDGVSINTAGLQMLDAEQMALTPLVARDVVMPRFATRPAYFENHTPLVSPDGMWLAAVSNTPNNDAVLLLYDMNLPEFPIEIAAGPRGSSITEVLFTPDSSYVVYVAGGARGENNSLFMVELASGIEQRLRRGRYGTGLMAPDGGHVALVTWQLIDDRQPPYMELVLVEVASGAERALLSGANIVEGRVTEQRFIFPLAWRSGV